MKFQYYHKVSSDIHHHKTITYLTGYELKQYARQHSAQQNFTTENLLVIRSTYMCIYAKKVYSKNIPVHKNYFSDTSCVNTIQTTAQSLVHSKTTDDKIYRYLPPDVTVPPTVNRIYE